MQGASSWIQLGDTQYAVNLYSLSARRMYLFFSGVECHGELEMRSVLSVD